MQIQVILSLVAILGAAAVALVVDFLRNRNQQLREAMVELNVRRQENERKAALAAAATPPLALPLFQAETEASPGGPELESVQTAGIVKRRAKSVDLAAARESAARQFPESPSALTAAPPPLVRVAPDSKPEPELALAAASESGIEFTSRRGRSRAARSIPVSDSGKEDNEVNSKQAVSEWLIKRAIARAAEKAAADGGHQSESEQVADAPGLPRLAPEAPGAPPRPAAPRLAPSHGVPAPVERKHEKPVINAPRLSGFGKEFEPVVIDEFLWESLFSGRNSGPPTDEQTKAEPVIAAKPEPAKPEPVFELIQGTGSQADLTITGGFHDRAALTRLAESHKLFSGLVVSIGVNQTDGRTPRGEELMQSIITFLQGLMRESDFACRDNEDELILICPGETGVAAQRHMSFLSERLWDFQLRSLGTLSILFSLGGIDVQRESLGEAIVSANERMMQTRRTRKAIVMLHPSHRKKAV